METEVTQAAERQVGHSRTLIPLLKSMTIGEWAATLTVFCSVVGGGFAFGTFVERQLRDEHVEAVSGPLVRQIDVLNQRNTELETDIMELSEEYVGLLNEVELQRSFVTFSENYINYLVSEDENARGILIDYVCALYRESQNSGKDVDFVTLSFQQISRGQTDVDLELLRNQNRSSDLRDLVRLIDELRQLETTGVDRAYPRISRYIGVEVQPRSVLGVNVRRQGVSIVESTYRRADEQFGGMIKEVVFPNQAPFRLPDEIAVAVHSNPSCRVR